MSPTQSQTAEAACPATTAVDTSEQSATSTPERLVTAFAATLKQAKDPLFTCASLIWTIDSTQKLLADCLYRSTQQEVLFNFRQRRLELDCSENGHELADCLVDLLSLGQSEQIIESLKTAFRTTTGCDFRMPKRIRWNDNEEAIYEF